jgi:effector-binding domain-containing protein
MAPEPQIQQRAKQPYVAIAAHVPTEAEFRKAADSGFPELFGWLQERGVELAGPPFIRYVVMDAEGDPVDIELAFPVGAGVSGNERVRADALPAGAWATYLHVGPYNSASEPDLGDARATLRTWIDEQGIQVDIQQTDNGSELRGCVEHYRIGPVEETDHSKWETEVAYLTTAS